MNVGEALFDRALGTPEYREARSVLRSYEQNQISAVAERGMQMRHLAEAALCIPKLVAEVAVDGLTVTIVWLTAPLVFAAAFDLFAVIGTGGRSVATGSMTHVGTLLYSDVTSLVLRFASTPVLIAGGITIVLAVGVARQVIGDPDLIGLRNLRHHVHGAWDPVGAARSRCTEHRVRCWDQYKEGLKIAGGVLVLVASVVSGLGLRRGL